MVAGAPAVLQEAGVADRCRIVAGSFFEDVPEGGDAYVLKAVIHDWEDDQAAAILRVCRRAVPAHGALLVIERDLGPPNENPEAKFSDLNMLVGPGGRERTVDEFEELLERTGFRLTGVARGAAGFHVFEATSA